MKHIVKLRNTYLINLGFKPSGINAWYNKDTDHFICIDDFTGKLNLSYLLDDINLGDYDSFTQIETFLKGVFWES